MSLESRLNRLEGVTTENETQDTEAKRKPILTILADPELREQARNLQRAFEDCGNWSSVLAKPELRTQAEALSRAIEQKGSRENDTGKAN